LAIDLKVRDTTTESFVSVLIYLMNFN